MLLLSSRFRMPHRHVSLGRARLYGDRIDLRGWGLRGRYRRRIPLSHVASFEYHGLEAGANLSIYLVNGDQMHLHVKEAHRWRERFEQWLEYDVLPSAKLVGNTEEAAAIAG